jgi:hypothetical protein
MILELFPMIVAAMAVLCFLAIAGESRAANSNLPNPRGFLSGGELDADLSASSPDDFARFAHKRVRCDGELKRRSDNSVDIRGKVRAAG